MLGIVCCGMVDKGENYIWFLWGKIGVCLCCVVVIF